MICFPTGKTIRRRTFLSPRICSLAAENPAGKAADPPARASIRSAMRCNLREVVLKDHYLRSTGLEQNDCSPESALL